MALLSVVATLLVALFVCLGAAESREQHATVTVAVQAPGAQAYTCPYDSQHCGVFAHLSPAVLTAPPPATPVSAEPPHRAPPLLANPVRDSRALPRAPGRHVLQVMRT
ncbi:hypothetical protein [Streptomyces sp. H27-C3]|uniref:hypothetical protein n=1 Tax=Streptomyces sp. H27-C3 TaxID=3046305 RepID=UPI0024B9DB16|nr:hypothetical protein [Streptomyces sp. H27-C3]MDJ0466845.1 hypothetical protein [Streptomyces sp. H27-C3]